MAAYTAQTFDRGPIDKGYAVTYDQAIPEAGYNAYLSNGRGEILGLWIKEMSASFGMSGSFAQSAQERQWFPHNFQQASYQIAGQCANSFQYQQLGEFARQSHLDALDNSRIGILDLTIPEKGIHNHRHMSHKLSGYILGVRRGAERFINAPTYQFDFTVMYASEGLFQISEGRTHKLSQYMALLKPESTASAWRRRTEEKERQRQKVTTDAATHGDRVTDTGRPAISLPIVGAL